MMAIQINRRAVALLSVFILVLLAWLSIRQHTPPEIPNRIVINKDVKKIYLSEPKLWRDKGSKMSSGSPSYIVKHAESEEMRKYEHTDVKPHVLQDHCHYSLENERFDCFPDNYNDLNQTNCEKRGCCWKTAIEKGAPVCFYPKVYPSYRVTDSQKTASGFVANLMRNTPSVWFKDVKYLSLDVTFESNNCLHFKIYDPKNKRFKVPVDLPQRAKQKVDQELYHFTVEENPFSITVIRKSTREVVFTSKGVAPLIFSDQFIQFGTKLPSSNLYGLGERRGPLLLNLAWKKVTFWASDHLPDTNSNLYGVHPFYLNMENDQKANGVFLLNSNAIQVDLQTTPALTYRAIGGILDFYVFFGPTPDDVIRQYIDIIGRPRIPTFWSLGFHLCRWGYNSSAGLQAIINRMRAADMPYDTQWSDIDYMSNYLDFTYNHTAYKELRSIVADLHAHGQHYIPIIDPGISNAQPKGTYPAYDEGIQKGVFVMKSDGSGPLIGRVWPGTTVFPDFFNNKTADWWYGQLKRYHDAIPFDGLWIDKNEPSNLPRGSTTDCKLDRFNYPMFQPVTHYGSLIYRTLCLSARQAVSIHYNLHNLYGFSEARASSHALQKILKKRSVVITRSSYSSTGRYAGHWTGDNRAKWADLAWSVPAILGFQMFGIPLVGADICGFKGSTTPELCTRWTQLGAFYPFMRNHNYMKDPDQDPAAFDKKTESIMRSAIRIRYHLLPFLYTLFYHSNTSGSVVAKPIFFNYPSVDTYKIDRQFFWGNDLLISPVLEKGAKNVTAYIPVGVWYDFYSGQEVKGSGDYITLNAPLDTINLHIRGGAIIPTLPPAVTTTLMRSYKFGLIVALSPSGAFGDLYWDNGDELNAIENKHYTYVTFISVEGTNSVSSKVISGQYDEAVLGSMRILGVILKPTRVILNNIKVKFQYYSLNKTLIVHDMAQPLHQPFTIKWIINSPSQ